MNNNLDLPLVSICIPSYNHEKYVAETIVSVILQDYQNIELIIIDDCSEDNSDVIINSFVDKCKARFLRFEYYKNTENKGISYNLNQAIKWSQGKYFYAIASDDILMPFKTSLLVSQIEKLDNTYAAIFGDALFINEKGSLYKLSNSPVSFIDYHLKAQRRISNNSKTIEITYKNILLGNFLPAMSSLIKLKNMREVKGFTNGNRVEDLEMWLKLLQKYRIYLINKPVAYYRLHQHNSSTINRLNNLKDELYIIGSQKNFAVHNNCQIEFYNKIATLIAFINKIDPDYAKYSMKLYKLEVIQTSAYSFNYKIIE